MTFEELMKRLSSSSEPQVSRGPSVSDYVKSQIDEDALRRKKPNESAMSQIFKLVGSLAPVAAGALMGGGEGAAIGAGVASQNLSADAERRRKDEDETDKYLRDRSQGFENMYLKSAMDAENMAAKNMEKDSDRRQSLIGQALLQRQGQDAAMERAKVTAKAISDRYNNRKEENISKEQRSGVKAVKGQMLSTKQYKDAQQSRFAGGLLNELIAANKGGNQVSSSMIKTKMAKLAGEVGALTESDVTRYATSPAKGRIAADKWNQWTAGNFSNATTAELQELVTLMTRKASADLKAIEDEFISQYSKTYEVDEGRARELFGLGGGANSKPSDKKTISADKARQMSDEELMNLLKDGWEVEGL
ncbi:MAG: hypothetical protein E6Q97_25220 [Desulfurellales bacterium]|nr:MAG: hypothetical protein E6Q97_25220 [Desulfurellales bacterium]